jgi:hypothetical protein
MFAMKISSRHWRIMFQRTIDRNYYIEISMKLFWMLIMLIQVVWRWQLLTFIQLEKGNKIVMVLGDMFELGERQYQTNIKLLLNHS